MSSPLVRWLAGLTTDELAGILARRPDTLTSSPPADLSALAARLQDRASAVAALGALPCPAVQLVEALQAFGGPTVGRDQLAAAIGRCPDDPEFDAALRTLAGWALVWPDGDDLRMSGPLWSAFPHPLGLGAPAARLLTAVPERDLREMAAALGLPVARTRQKLVAAVAAALADGDRVRALVAAAPPDARELLRSLARSGPLVAAPVQFEVRSPDGPAIAWAVRHGLLVWDGWHHAQLPGEVAMALRGPEWRAPFEPYPPELALVDADAAAVAREAAAAATAAVEQVTTLLEAAGSRPIALLKAGGVGSREVRRLATVVGCGEPELRLWLELAHAAELLGVAGGQVQPTEAYDDWRVGEPADRLAALLAAWQEIPGAPLAPRRPDGGPAPAPLLRDGAWLAAYDLRPILLRVAAELPDGRGAADSAQVAAALRWRLPLLTGSVDELLGGLWEEARLLGVIAHGALTPLGRALLDDPGTLRDAAEALLPPAVREAVFQNDLTAMAPGLPAAELATLLDTAAERESRGTATTWRFTSGSLRAALDAGYEPDELIAALRTAAVGRTLPQSLEILIAEAGRRHGRIRVRAVGCVLRVQDAALATELLRARALRPLELAALAPTVLASVRPVAETLAALRAAGYAPAGEDADGEPLIERAPRRRAPALRRPGRGRRGGAPSRKAAGPAVDPTEVAERLLAGPIPEPAPVAAVREPRRQDGWDEPDASPMDAADAAVRQHAAQLTDGEQEALMAAIRLGQPMRINYRDAAGEFSIRVIEPMEVDRHFLVAWCRLRDDERKFALDRIEAVRPA